MSSITYSLSGSCMNTNQPSESTTALVVVTTLPDGTQPRVSIVSMTEPGGYFVLPLSTSVLTPGGGNLGRWNYTEVGGMLEKSGQIEFLNTGGTKTLRLTGTTGMAARFGGGVPSTRTCSFGFNEPFAAAPPAPAMTLPHGVPLVASGTCAWVENYSYACVPGTPGREVSGCCQSTTPGSLPDDIEFQVDVVAGRERLRVLRAPHRTPKVASVIVDESGGAFISPKVTAKLQRGAFVITTSEDIDVPSSPCGASTTRNTCQLFYAP